MKFLCDQNLGRLAKWLRLLGFDTIYMRTWNEKMIEEAFSTQRMILTRKRNMSLHDGCMVIKDDNVSLQLQQVMDAFPLDVHKRPFSRCSICNTLLDPIDRENVKGRVPEYVYHIHAAFSQCPSCARIYWQGTHTEKALAIMHKHK